MKDRYSWGHRLFWSELCDYQRKTIEAYLSGRNVFVSAPTGAGKSLTFELAPYAFDHLFGEDCNAIVLVIVPLISLREDQVSNLNSRGIRALYVGDNCSEEQLKDILNLKQKIVSVEGDHHVLQTGLFCCFFDCLYHDLNPAHAVLWNMPPFSSVMAFVPQRFKAFPHSVSKACEQGFRSCRHCYDTKY